MNLFIFSNDQYGFGQHVWEAGVAWADARPDVTVTVVFSTRRPARSQPSRFGWVGDHVLIPLRRHRQDRAYRRQVRSHGLGSKLQLVQSVNAAAFLSTIPEGSVGLIAGFNQILSAQLLERFSWIANVHPSILPLYRGPVPTRWCIEHKETQTGYTVHLATARIDEGAVLFQEVQDILPGQDEEEVEQALSIAAAAVVPSLLSKVLDGDDIVPVTIDASRVYTTPVSYAGFDSASMLER